jgi:hypothetical protein
MSFWLVLEHWDLVCSTDIIPFTHRTQASYVIRSKPLCNANSIICMKINWNNYFPNAEIDIIRVLPNTL